MRAMVVAVLTAGLWGGLAGPFAAELEGQGPPDRMHRRAELEQQVRQRFMEQVSERLELSETQRVRMAAILQEGAEARRELAEDSRALRRELMQAVHREDATMPTYERLLQRLAAVRETERAIEQREEQRLAEVLDARQRAVFLIMRMQLNDRIRGMRGTGGGPGGPPPGGPGAGPQGGPGGGPHGGPAGEWPGTG